MFGSRNTNRCLGSVRDGKRTLGGGNRTGRAHRPWGDRNLRRSTYFRDHGRHREGAFEMSPGQRYVPQGEMRLLGATESERDMCPGTDPNAHRPRIARDRHPSTHCPGELCNLRAFECNLPGEGTQLKKPVATRILGLQCNLCTLEAKFLSFLRNVQRGEGGSGPSSSIESGTPPPGIGICAGTYISETTEGIEKAHSRCPPARDTCPRGRCVFSGPRKAREICAPGRIRMHTAPESPGTDTHRHIARGSCATSEPSSATSPEKVHNSRSPSRRGFSGSSATCAPSKRNFSRSSEMCRGGRGVFKGMRTNVPSCTPLHTHSTFFPSVPRDSKNFSSSCRTGGLTRGRQSILQSRHRVLEGGGVVSRRGGRKHDERRTAGTRTPFNSFLFATAAPLQRVCFQFIAQRCLRQWISISFHSSIQSIEIPRRCTFQP